MIKTFRPWLVDQPQFLPPSVQDLVPSGHLAHFVRDLVRDDLDLSGILSSYDEVRGCPPFDPRMMTALLLYGYSRGVYSSRRLARAGEKRVDFMAVTAQNRPDFRTIAKFRRRHLDALAGLFVQVLKLCQRGDLVELGHVALDGTKMKANASKHKAMSYGRMKTREADLAAEVEGWLKAAEAADAEEDAAFGDKRGDEMFAGSDCGGQRAAAIYSLIVTAKMNEVDPQAWLADVLARIAGHPASRLDDLLPWNWRKQNLRDTQAA